MTELSFYTLTQLNFKFVWKAKNYFQILFHFVQNHSPDLFFYSGLRVRFGKWKPLRSFYLIIILSLLSLMASPIFKRWILFSKITFGSFNRGEWVQYLSGSNRFIECFLFTFSHYPFKWKTFFSVRLIKLLWFVLRFKWYSDQFCNNHWGPGTGLLDLDLDSSHWSWVQIWERTFLHLRENTTALGKWPAVSLLSDSKKSFCRAEWMHCTLGEKQCPGKIRLHPMGQWKTHQPTIIHPSIVAFSFPWDTGEHFGPGIHLLSSGKRVLRASYPHFRPLLLYLYLYLYLYLCLYLCFSSEHHIPTSDRFSDIHICPLKIFLTEKEVVFVRRQIRRKTNGEYPVTAVNNECKSHCPVRTVVARWL